MIVVSLSAYVNVSIENIAGFSEKLYSDIDAIIGEDEGGVGGCEFSSRHFDWFIETATSLLARCCAGRGSLAAQRCSDSRCTAGFVRELLAGPTDVLVLK